MKKKSKVVVSFLIAFVLFTAGITLTLVGGGSADPRALGIIYGLAIGIIIAGIILTITKKDDSTKCKYDERQEIVRGRGYKYGFFTTMVCNVLMLVLNEMDVKLFQEMSIAMFVSVLAGVGVFASYCIWNDSYFALNENFRSVMVMFIVVAFINLSTGISNVVNGTAIQNGGFTFESMNLFCGILFVLIFAVLLAKRVKDGKEE